MDMFKEPRVGRPPKSDEERMDQPFRCLGTKQLKEYWQLKAAEQGLTESDMLRLAIYNLIRPWAKAPLDDPTFIVVKK